MAGPGRVQPPATQPSGEAAEAPPSSAADAKAQVEADHEQNMKDQYEMMALQSKISADNLFMTTMSNIKKADDDTKKGIANKIG